MDSIAPAPSSEEPACITTKKGRQQRRPEIFTNPVCRWGIHRKTYNVKTIRAFAPPRQAGAENNHPNRNSVSGAERRRENGCPGVAGTAVSPDT